ncbi:hypothetical protein [Paenibacillus chitinolyticus]|uniref:hypothetical protein n=1 Tax=Paenibacillus chitinolyticus TaxID=79263 RepID=UPI00363285D5
MNAAGYLFVPLHESSFGRVVFPLPQTIDNHSSWHLDRLLSPAANGIVTVDKKNPARRFFKAFRNHAQIKRPGCVELLYAPQLFIEADANPAR